MTQGISDILQFVEENDVKFIRLAFCDIFGVQKNIGPAGVVVAIIKDSLLAQAKEDVPVVLQYKTYVEHDSTYNTPPVFGIYFINKVMHWLEDNGGLEGAYRRNVQKAGIVYAAIDGSDGFYRGHAAADSRSLMNVTFNLPTAELEGAFVAQAAERGLIGLKGHRSLGGCRALAEFMEEFRKNH